MRRKWKFIVPVLALLGTCLLFRFVLFIGYVPSESMEPTLKRGSIIVGSRLFGELKVGDIIVFRHEGRLLVKRIAATEGDMVKYRGNTLIVPDKKFYMLGDNRDNSSDSRVWERPFIEQDDMLAILFPAERSKPPWQTQAYPPPCTIHKNDVYYTTNTWSKFPDTKEKPMSTILIVEDDKAMQDIIADYMRKGGHTCFTADDGIDALMLLKSQPMDLLILDIMMPHLDGFSVCKIAREMGNMPIILLTAKSSEEDKLKGYEYGADDYMTKPFSPKVLLAKVNALLRRSSPMPAGMLCAGELTLHPDSHRVFLSGEEVSLTHTEYELLHFFMANPGQIFTREQLLNRIWGYDFDGSTRTVDVHIKNLRQKLGDAGRYIVTLIRSGYKFEVAK